MSDTAAAWQVDRLDLRVAERLCRLVGVDDPALVTLAALAAAAPRGGHVCVDLVDVLGEVVCERPPAHGTGERPAPEPLAPLGDVGDLLERAAATPLVRDADRPDRVTPLVVDDTRVYLDRYWRYEDRLHRQLVARSTTGHELASGQHDVAAVRRVLAQVAPAADGTVDRQRLAVANGLLRALSVLSGGPGTGKTHTIVSLLAAHVLLASGEGRPPPRTAIAAPTGKAAARLEEAIRDAVRDRDLPAPAIAVVAGLRGQTLHRLLGWQHRTPTRFRHDADHPLPHDLVVVDEASMVPLSLMAKLVDAVRDDATLVLVGDRDQLTSVEAGAVLGDVCGPQPTGSSLRLSRRWTTVLTDVTGADVAAARAPMPHPGVWDGIVQLERFRRFGPDSGIGAVARAIKAVPDGADVTAARPVIAALTGRDAVGARGEQPDDGRDVALLTPEEGSALPRELRPVVTGSFAPYLDAVADGDAEQALRAIDALRVLCAVREGPQGVRAVGALVERWLAAAHDHVDVSNEWYVGRPVLVTRNDHDLGVMNGDVGVTLDRGGRLGVVFRLADGALREVPTVRLADCETVWATTIHKAQGSQFDQAVVVLPDRDVDVVTRELVYTGVTRARRRVVVVADPDRLAAAVVRPVRRATGLRQRLWT